ncbi:MAG: hypothetical protein IKI49_05180 [Oscillospiraceae bacterium]|nr:hypothetical protein [Oscillospiraceae bacterium]
MPPHKKRHDENMSCRKQNIFLIIFLAPLGNFSCFIAPQGLFSFTQKKIDEKKAPKGEDSDFFPLWKPLIETAKGNASFPFDSLRAGEKMMVFSVAEHCVLHINHVEVFIMKTLSFFSVAERFKRKQRVFFCRFKDGDQ